MTRYTLDRTISSYGKVNPQGSVWVDAPDANEAVAIFESRHGRPLSVRHWPDDERATGDPVLRACYVYGPGEELTVTVYLTEELN